MQHILGEFQSEGLARSALAALAGVDQRGPQDLAGEAARVRLGDYSLTFLVPETDSEINKASSPGYYREEDFPLTIVRDRDPGDVTDSTNVVNVPWYDKQSAIATRDERAAREREDWTADGDARKRQLRAEVARIEDVERAQGWKDSKR